MRKIWANSLLLKALKSYPKLKKIAQSGHTACRPKLGAGNGDCSVVS